MPNRQPLTPEDILKFENIGDAQLSPDGKTIAFVRGKPFKPDGVSVHATIWLCDVATGKIRQLTSGPRTDTLPRWSPDGKQLAFLSNRLSEKQKQIFLIDPHGGEARALTTLKGIIPTPRGLNALQWSPDGQQLGFLLKDSYSEEERTRRRQKDDAIVFEQNPLYVRAWSVRIDDQSVRCISPEQLQVWEFSWHPDSQRMAATVSDVPYESAWYSNRLVTFAIEGDTHELWSSSRQVSLPGWSPDGSQVTFISATWSDRGCAAGDLWTIAAEGGEANHVSAGTVASFGWYSWTTDSRQLLAIGHERGGTGIHRFDIPEKTATALWWEEAAVTEAHWPRFSVASDNTIALIKEDPAHPRDLWVGQLQGDQLDWKQLTNLHPLADTFLTGETSFHHWQGADDWPMQGLLIKPTNYEPGTSYPLVMWVHGGPTGVSGSRYYTSFGWCQLMANAGYAVFLPNYRGSVGWGLEFSESNLGDMGGKDFEDMLLGIDSLVDAGIADAERLAVAGWSYGGFISAWAVSQSQRFRAAVMGAGISHWSSFHGKSCLSDWDAMYYQADPYERSGKFEQFSPITYAHDIQTPTLILHGEQDQDVPVEQAYTFFRTLKDQEVPVELVVYPRESHAVTERLHMLDMSRRVLAWLDTHL
jgi:dipeptidyl aminopeptidase/acylaminoacyl peptidase